MTRYGMWMEEETVTFLCAVCKRFKKKITAISDWKQWRNAAAYPGLQVEIREGGRCKYSTPNNRKLSKQDYPNGGKRNNRQLSDSERSCCSGNGPAKI